MSENTWQDGPDIRASWDSACEPLWKGRGSTATESRVTQMISVPWLFPSAGPASLWIGHGFDARHNHGVTVPESVFHLASRVSPETILLDNAGEVEDLFCQWETPK